MARMTTTAYASVNGFPVRNDGKLSFDDVKGSYNLDIAHLFQLATTLGICANGVDVGRIKDDRTKKSGKSLAKDDQFIRENPGFCDMYDEKAIADLFSTVTANGIFLKCDVNFNSHLGKHRDEVNEDARSTRLIFVFGLAARDNATGKDIYVKFDFTNARNGIVAHLDSLHYYHGGL